MPLQKNHTLACVACLAVDLFLAVGCVKQQVVAGPPVDAAALHAQAQAAHRVPETLSCDGKAFVDAPENGGRYALHISVKRPASLRIEALTPLGDPAAVLVASEGKFALMDLRNNVFYRGPASPRNLSRLIPAPFTPDELVALITGAIPDLRDAQPQAARREGDGYLLTLAAPGTVETVTLGGDLRVTKVRRTTERGDLLWEVTLDEHDDSTGAQLPRLIHLEAPLGKTRVDLRLRNLLAGKPPPQGAFLLGVPQGMRVEEVE
jgi:outer membrane biogenesis lipoprotein LolB